MKLEVTCKMNKPARRAYSKLEKNTKVHFQYDDGEESYEAVKQLKENAGAIGIKYFEVGHSLYLINFDKNDDVRV